MLAVGSEDKSIKIFDISQLIQIQNSDIPKNASSTISMLSESKNLHSKWIQSIAFSTDDLLLASAGYDHQLIIYELKSISSISATQENYYSSMKISPLLQILKHHDGNNIIIEKNNINRHKAHTKIF